MSAVNKEAFIRHWADISAAIAHWVENLSHVATHSRWEQADDTWGFLSNFAGQLFLSNVAWEFSHWGNKFLSGYFRSVVGPVSHLVARWWQH